jgi:prolyl-tRNA editing enzyme YbaK/EbsC (Cys-tRNA(Pro) deacylase)
MPELESVRVLEEKGVDFRLIELEDRAISVDDVIKFAKEDINPREICKTIVMKDDEGDKLALLLLGNRRVDFKKARETIGGKLRIASFDEVKEATGVEPGAVCPLLLQIPLFVDEAVLSRERINFGSGDHLYGMEIRSRDLSKVVDYKLVDVAES